MELATELLKRRMMAILRASDVQEARRYLDSVVIYLPEMDQLKVTAVAEKSFRGSWFINKNRNDQTTMLYFHGGGYSFYPKSYANFIGLLTLAAKCKTFALDYSLAPEHRFPAQLEEALAAYRWLLKEGTDPDRLVLGGDSAGGNLALAVLLSARDLKLPLPALAIALSPPTDFETDRTRLIQNQQSDWIEEQMLARWSAWFCDPDQGKNPLVSPLRADLRGLPPIYIQAGRAEILYDSIFAFAEHARNAGADVLLESWEDMNHVFQIFGRYVPQSAEALQRLGEVIALHVRTGKRSPGTAFEKFAVPFQE